MDFMSNLTGDQHQWFIASSQPSHKNYEKYKEYIIMCGQMDPKTLRLGNFSTVTTISNRTVLVFRTFFSMKNTQLFESLL